MFTRPKKMTNLPNISGSSGPLQKIAAFIVTLVVIGLGLMFSLAVFSFLLVAGAIAWVYLWWKTRELRKQMRDFQSHTVAMGGDAAEGEIIRGEVIEGEVVRVVETIDTR